MTSLTPGGGMAPREPHKLEHAGSIPAPATTSAGGHVWRKDKARTDWLQQVMVCTICGAERHGYERALYLYKRADGIWDRYPGRCVRPAA